MGEDKKNVEEILQEIENEQKDHDNLVKYTNNPFLYHIEVINQAHEAAKQAIEYTKSIKELNKILAKLDLEIKPINITFWQKLKDLFS